MVEAGADGVFCEAQDGGWKGGKGHDSGLVAVGVQAVDWSGRWRCIKVEELIALRESLFDRLSWSMRYL